MTEEIKEIGVVGSGQMGSGISLIAAANGVDVLLKDSDPAALVRARKYIFNFSQNLFSNGQISQVQANDALKRLKYYSKLEEFHSVDIMIEAIVESETVKKKLFSELDEIANKSAILASNTSSISISHIATATGRSQQVIGMHFMYPAPVMKLIDFTRGADTSDNAFRRTEALTESL